MRKRKSRTEKTSPFALWGEAKKVPATVPTRQEIYEMIRKRELHHVPEWVRIAWKKEEREADEYWSG